MYTKQALREIGLDGSELLDAQRKAPEQQALVPQDFAKPCPGEIHLTAPAGSVAILNS